jgi:hypothetical protein
MKRTPMHLSSKKLYFFSFQIYGLIFAPYILRFPFVASKLLASKSSIFSNYFFKKQVKKASPQKPNEDKNTFSESNEKKEPEKEHDPFDDFEAMVLLTDQDLNSSSN